MANRRHDVIAVHVSDPREEFLPDVGLVAVEDAESGHETLVDTSVRSVREEYARAARQRTKTRDEIFRRTGVDVISVRTDRSYVNELYRFFRMRERRYG